MDKKKTLKDKIINHLTPSDWTKEEDEKLVKVYKELMKCNAVGGLTILVEECSDYFEKSHTEILERLLELKL